MTRTTWMLGVLVFVCVLVWDAQGDDAVLSSDSDADDDYGFVGDEESDERNLVQYGRRRERLPPKIPKQHAVVVTRPVSTPVATPKATPEVKPNVKPRTTREVKPEATPKATPEATPEVKPEATPKATPEVKPEATPKATPEVKPEATPKATPEATPKATPEVKPEATPEVKPEATPEVKPEATPEVKPEATPEVKPEATPEVKPEATPEVKPEATPEVKPEATPEVKPEATPEVKPEATPEVKPEATPEVKPEATPEVKPEATPEVKPEATPEVKPEATPEAKTGVVKQLEDLVARMNAAEDWRSKWAASMELLRVYNDINSKDYIALTAENERRAAKIKARAARDEADVAASRKRQEILLSAAKTKLARAEPGSDKEKELKNKLDRLKATMDALVEKRESIRQGMHDEIAKLKEEHDVRVGKITNKIKSMRRPMKAWETNLIATCRSTCASPFLKSAVAPTTNWIVIAFGGRSAAQHACQYITPLQRYFLQNKCFVGTVANFPVHWQYLSAIFLGMWCEPAIRNPKYQPGVCSQENRDEYKRIIDRAQKKYPTWRVPDKMYIVTARYRSVAAGRGQPYKSKQTPKTGNSQSAGNNQRPQRIDANWMRKWRQSLVMIRSLSGVQKTDDKSMSKKRQQHRDEINERARVDSLAVTRARDRQEKMLRALQKDLNAAADGSAKKKTLESKKVRMETTLKQLIARGEAILLERNKALWNLERGASSRTTSRQLTLTRLRKTLDPWAHDLLTALKRPCSAANLRTANAETNNWLVVAMGGRAAATRVCGERARVQREYLGHKLYMGGIRGLPPVWGYLSALFIERVFCAGGLNSKQRVCTEQSRRELRIMFAGLRKKQPSWGNPSRALIMGSTSTQQPGTGSQAATQAVKKMQAENRQDRSASMEELSKRDAELKKRGIDDQIAVNAALQRQKMVIQTIDKQLARTTNSATRAKLKAKKAQAETIIAGLVDKSRLAQKKMAEDMARQKQALALRTRVRTVHINSVVVKPAAWGRALVRFVYARCNAKQFNKPNSNWVVIAMGGRAAALKVCNSVNSLRRFYLQNKTYRGGVKGLPEQWRYLATLLLEYKYCMDAEAREKDDVCRQSSLEDLREVHRSLRAKHSSWGRPDPALITIPSAAAVTPQATRVQRPVVTPKVTRVQRPVVTPKVTRVQRPVVTPKVTRVQRSPSYGRQRMPQWGRTAQIRNLSGYLHRAGSSMRAMQQSRMVKLKAKQIQVGRSMKSVQVDALAKRKTTLTRSIARKRSLEKSLARAKAAGESARVASLHLKLAELNRLVQKLEKETIRKAAGDQSKLKGQMAMRRDAANFSRNTLSQRLNGERKKMINKYEDRMRELSQRGKKSKPAFKLPQKPVATPRPASPRKPVATPRPAAPRKPVATPRPVAPRQPVATPRPASPRQPEAPSSSSSDDDDLNVGSLMGVIDKAIGHDDDLSQRIRHAKHTLRRTQHRGKRGKLMRLVRRLMRQRRRHRRSVVLLLVQD